MSHYFKLLILRCYILPNCNREFHYCAEKTKVNYGQLGWEFGLQVGMGKINFAI